MGMGGSFRVFSIGFESFYGNPAGFAAARGSFTAPDVNAWIYLKPTKENLDKLKALADGQMSGSDTAAFMDSLITDNGLGAGASVGLGWSGGGYGAGCTVVADSCAVGNSLVGSKLTAVVQANGILGAAGTINLGFGTLDLGANARAFYQIRTPAAGWEFYNLVQAYMSGSQSAEAVLRDQDAEGGVGLAVDAGTTLRMGCFMLGAMIRDFGIQVNMKTEKVGEILDSGQLPQGGGTGYSIKPLFVVGAGFTLDNSKIFVPSLYVEAEDPAGIISAGLDTAWKRLHAGAEIKLLDCVALRAGLNKGWVSLGAGVDLFALKLDAAIFTEELGTNPGDFGRSGIAVEVGIRL